MNGIDSRIVVEEFWSSVGFWLLVAGLVGDLLVPLVPKHRNRLETGLTMVFTFAIIVGVAIERIADKNISWLVSQMQSSTALQVSQAQAAASAASVQVAKLMKEAEAERLKRVEIEEKMAWRRLTQEEVSEIGSRLQNFPGETGAVWFNASDIEGDTFASDIAAALHAAKWRVVGPASFMDLVEPISNPPPLSTGVTVVSTGDESSLKASNALVQELKHFGFDCTKSSKIEFRPVHMVFVNVESRPDGPQGEAKLRQQHGMVRGQQHRK